MAITEFKEGGTDLTDIYLDNTSLIDVFYENYLYAWGDNAYGVQGRNNITDTSLAAMTFASTTNKWIDVSAGGLDITGDGVAAVGYNGTLWVCGVNNAGQLGTNNIVARSLPVQVGTGTDWKQVSMGATQLGAIKTDGTLWMSGNNISGEIGDNTRTSRSSPVQIAGTNWKQISCGVTFSAAIKTDGTLWSWGNNSYGQLGSNNIAHRSSPIQVGTGTNWKQISCGGTFSAAIKTDGTLWSWGINNNGRLGDNTIISKSSPVQIAGTTWKQVSCGPAHTAAIKTDGTLWSWGNNSYGQLGSNNIAHRSSPTQVGTGTDWKQASSGGSSSGGYTVAIKTDGSLWAWGSGANGTLGNGSLVHRSSPVQISNYNTGWIYSFGGVGTVFAIRT